MFLYVVMITDKLHTSFAQFILEPKLLIAKLVPFETSTQRQRKSSIIIATWTEIMMVLSPSSTFIPKR
jgi:hypothetical protein